MTEPTDADRQRAWLVLSALPISIPGYSPETVRKANDHLATALAEERGKARAPFLALAVLLDGAAITAASRDHRAFVPGAEAARAKAYRDAADRIRRAAEEQQQ